MVALGATEVRPVDDHSISAIHPLVIVPSPLVDDGATLDGDTSISAAARTKRHKAKTLLVTYKKDYSLAVHTHHRIET